MTSEKIIRKWYPEYYDRRETQTYDWELMIELLGSPKKVLEICCGTGRILLPLAKAGHEMHGIDMDNYMLSKLFSKADGAKNIHIHKGNILTENWGRSFDAVLLAGNILINIEGSNDYKADQQLLIKKAYDSLKPSGYLLMDNDGWHKPETFFRTTDEVIVKELGTFSEGIKARRIFFWSKYDVKTQTWTGEDKFELIYPDGTIHSSQSKRLKYIPLIDEMTGWVKNAGFEIENLWGDHYKNPITEETYNRFVCWARKPE
jgi:SAM-dependent methyltransferase